MCSKLHYIKQKDDLCNDKDFKKQLKESCSFELNFLVFWFFSFCFPAAYSMSQIQDPELHFGSAFQALLDIKGTNYSRGHCRD